MRGKTSIFAFLAAIAALALWLVCGRSAAREAIYPVEKVHSDLVRGPWNSVKAIFRPAATAAENQRLKAENSKLAMFRGECERLAAENLRLRSLLSPEADDSVPLPTNHWMAARVLSVGGAVGVGGLMRVARGSVDGVSTNSAVAVPQGLVGRVESVTRHTADVRLITSPLVKVACEIETGDAEFGRVRGILEGGGERAVGARPGARFLYLVDPLRIRYLERRPRLPARARIITSGLGGIYPRGLTVGYLIGELDEDDVNLEREGDVLPAVDFHLLEDVFIRREN